MKDKKRWKKMKTTIKLIMGFLMFVLFIGISGCVLNEKQQGTIKIMTSLPMRRIDVGQDIYNGIRMALEEADYKAGKFKIEIISEDDSNRDGAWSKDLEERIAEKAVADPDVMVYIGPFNSGAAKVSIPLTNQAGLVQISPGNTWPGLTKAGFLPEEPGIFYPTGIRNYFRVCPTDAVQGPAGAIWAKGMGFNNVYIFDDGEAFGKGIGDIFEKRAKIIGLNVVGHKTIDKKSKDFTKELTDIRDIQLDLIYFAGITPNGAVPLVKGIKELGITAKFMGPDGIMEQAFIDLGGDATEGAYVTVVGIPAKELKGKGKEFYENYLIRYNSEPGVYSAFGYEAANVALLAIKRAGVKDRAKILEEVSKIKNYDGLFGTWSFDQNGDTSLTIVSGSRVKNREFVFEKLLYAE